jgi:autotransporter-associated beta strand protein
MKPIARQKSRLLTTAAALALCATVVHAGTVSTTFSFQKGDLRKDGELYGAGASYAGVVDGNLNDSTATTLPYRQARPPLWAISGAAGSPNGQQHVGLFSYDLSELGTFIADNTSASSSVAITAVSFKLISAGVNSGDSYSIRLFGTDPFTSGARWSTSDGSTAWSSPFQNIGSSAQYGHTGGASALTANLGGTSPNTSVASGNALEWTSSLNFINALTTALDRPDKTLHLTANCVITNWGGGSDSRLNVHFSPTATVDNRPELLVTLAVSSLTDWTGAVSDSWAENGNWTSPPGTGDNVRFNNSSIANLATVLNQDFDLNGIEISDPAGPVSIGGTNSLTLGSGGFDLSAATQDLTVTAPIIADAAQIWNIASDRSLGISGAVSGSGNITIAGAGKVVLGAANILPNGAGAGNLAVAGTLDLSGFSQSVNALTGVGTVDNTGAGAVTLTIGNNDAAGTFNGILKNTGGTLALGKTGGGTLTLTGPNEFSGGFTNDGTGIVYPNNNLAFGSGPVVSNAGTIYATAGSYTFANELTLNNSTLRLGGGNNRTVTWNGPVTATGTSGLSADGGTGGITLGSTLDIAGATFTSFANGTTNNINGDISGEGGMLNVTSGTLQLSGTNTYTGDTTLSGSATLRLQPGGTLAGSNLVINGSGNLNVRNTVGWVYGGSISGDGTGSVNLNTGTDATLAGGISGVASINVTTAGTNATISGSITGATDVNVQAAGATLTLSGDNSYTGNTVVSGGTLVLGAAGSIAGSASVSIGAGATLDTSAKATYAIPAAQPLAFGINAAGGTSGRIAAEVLDISQAVVSYNITGTPDDPVYVLATYTSLSGNPQFAFEPAPPTGYTLDYAYEGNKIALVQAGFSAWQSANNTTGGLDADHDNDGVRNGIEYFLDGPVESTGFTALPGVVNDNGTLSVTWVKAAGYNGGYPADFVVETSATLTGTWMPAGLGTGAGEVEITGNNVKFTFPSGATIFARLKVTGP